MNPLVLIQLLHALLGGAQVDPDASAKAPVPGVDLAGLTALMAALRQPEPAPVKLPGVASFIGSVIVLAFFALMAAIGALLVMGHDPNPALYVGFGGELILVSAVVFFLFGSSWGSRTKDARSGSGGQGGIIPVPVPTPQPHPSKPAPGPAPVVSPPAGIGRSTDKSTSGIRHDIPADGRAASIRYNNPGAQYPSDRAAAFGQLGYGIIGGNHKIALFPHAVNGAASNFDLLSRNYVGMKIGAAGAKWTGDNGFGIPGYDPNQTLTADMVRNPAQAIPILKAMAQREAGKVSPVTDEQWAQAHAMFEAGSADAWLTSFGSPTATEPDHPSTKRATGADIVALARPHIGEKYVNVLVPKDDPNWKGPWDCAEFASWLVYQVAGIIYGCTNDSDPPHVADAYTGAWKADAQSKGKMVSIATAAATPGAFLLRYPPAPGGMGHIVVSDGQGGTVEAAGTATGVVAGKIAGRRWDTGVLVPGIDYSSGATQSVQAPAKIYAIGQPNMSLDKVTEIQNALVVKGFSPGDIDGEYGQNTALAVVAFQGAKGLIADGEVGPDTAAALGITL